jgi:hypothetical protein
MCVLTRGRLKACKDQVGGIRRIWVEDFEKVNGKTYNADGELTEIGVGTILYQYNLPSGTAEFKQPIKASKENGTIYYDQNLSINLFGLSVADRKELQVMARMNLTIFAEDFNGNVFELGRDGGMDVNGGEVLTGKAKGDMSGYRLEFFGEEKDQAPFVTAYTATPFDGITTPSNVTITLGT